MKAIFYQYCRQFLYLALVFVLGGTAFIGYLGHYHGYFPIAPARESNLGQQLQQNFSVTAPLAQRRYKFCGHIERIALPPEIEKLWAQTGPTAATMLPEGWFIEKLPAGRYIFTQEIAGLCPACRPKRHLGAYEGWVAVFRGPAGSSGPLERVTPLRLEWLPQSWREWIVSGKAEFTEEAEMLQALDSLDEYRR